MYGRARAARSDKNNEISKSFSSLPSFSCRVSNSTLLKKTCVLITNSSRVLYCNLPHFSWLLYFLAVYPILVSTLIHSAPAKYIHRTFTYLPNQTEDVFCNHRYTVLKVQYFMALLTQLDPSKGIKSLTLVLFLHVLSTLSDRAFYHHLWGSLLILPPYETFLGVLLLLLRPFIIYFFSHPTVGDGTPMTHWHTVIERTR